jgi:uncharacterized membrane protein HdeD (DUF308 family)
MQEVAAMAMNFDRHVSETAEATKWWWVFLITGILWLWVSLIVFRFDITSVGAVGVLIGCVVIVAGVNEFMAMAVTQGGWRWVHAALGALFVVFGVIALFNPWDTFVSMAAIMGWVLVFLGTYLIVVAFMTRRENEHWWLQLIAGGASIGLAFWAAGNFGDNVIILISFVGAWCLIRGISEIILAFQIRTIHKRAEAGMLVPPGLATPPATPMPPQEPPPTPATPA